MWGMYNTKETKLIRIEIKETEFIIVVNCSSEDVWEELAMESLAAEVVRVVFMW